MKNACKIRFAIAIIVFILIGLAFFGFYPVKLLDLQFAALFQRTVVDFSIIAVVLLSLIILLTLLFGRFYCSILCPFGVFQEICAIIFKKKNAIQKNYPYKYLLSALTFGTMLGASALIIRYIEPYTLFGSALSLSKVGLIALVAVIALVFFKNRFFCTNICPAGAILGLISKNSVNKIYIDEKKCLSCGSCAGTCPSGCIDFKEKKVDNETCVRCLNCLDKCKKGALNFGIQPVKFNLNRRNLIWMVSTVALFGAAIKGGVEIGKNFANKIKDIILPAGAKDANRMANKCLNCNLCINSCPNGILVKADEKFPAVHIDYSKGKRYCKYDCNECSKTCPSGAIKKISLEEKQSTRIAIAAFDKEKCIRCGICARNCPLQAISLDEKNEPFLDGSKCIGCAKCAKSCPTTAIAIFGTNEQRRI